MTDKLGEFELNKIYCMDCLEGLKKIPDNSIDLVITDPPYNISIKGKKTIRNYKHYNWDRRSDIGLDFGEWDRAWENQEEYFKWVESWFSELKRILKEGSWIYIFFAKEMTGLFSLNLAPKYGFKTRTIYNWVKTNPVPSFRKVNWNSGVEHIWVGSKGDCKLKNFKDQKYMSNYFLSPNGSAYKETEHPTEKPKILIRHLIEVNSNKGEIILDMFSGSGTTCISALELGRKFIGFEINPEYCKMANKRLAQEVLI